MPTSCEFLNCLNTSDDTKVNRLRIHENLAQKWKQVFNENLNHRIGEYLYICCAHFDSNTKKLILPNPTKVQEIEEVTRVVKKEVPSHVSSNRKAAALEKTKSWIDEDQDDEDDEPLVKIQKRCAPAETFLPEQMFIEVEMDDELLPEIKQEFEDDVVHVHEGVEKERSPIRHAPDLSSMVPETMKPKVLLSSNVEEFKKTKTYKRKYDKMSKELQKILVGVDKAKMKNEFLKKDLMITRNRIKFIEENFGGAPSKRNNPELMNENE